MPKAASNKLSAGHRKALGLPGLQERPDEEKQQVDASLSAYYDRHELLQDIPAGVIRKAWFTMAHLILEPQARVVDIGCADGIMTYAMAALNPQFHFTGVDLNKKAINKARQTHKLPNLTFQTGDISKDAGLEKESLDAVINSFILHDIFSGSKYNERHVIHTLENQFGLLKQNGLLFIRDFARPPPEEYVLLEMPDTPGKGKALADMSEPDLLVWYSENARPRQDRGCHGFFLEERPPRFPQTRLFRLPYKWAYEFVMRKDNRAEWETELPKEYTFFTPREYRKTMRDLSARVLYTAPHWDQTKIKKNFEDRFHLYSDDGKPLGAPPTSFIAVAQKRNEKESLRIHERRPSQTSDHLLKISAMRNESDGRLVDVVSREIDITEVIPYRVTENGELNVFIHTGLPRGIVNVVPRAGKELDGKRWSGHMTEAITVPTDIIHDVDEGGVKESVLFARDYLGLKPAIESTLEKGPSYYPAPDYIDELIRTRFLRVTEHEGAIQPKTAPDDITGFTTLGHLREVSAQSLLNAISVGFIPNARLELQILSLYEMLDIEAETWVDCPLTLKESIPESTLDGKDLMSKMAAKDNRYKKVKGSAGKLRSVQSIFIDEGHMEGGIVGMASRDMEFVISDEHTINTASVLPLTRNIQSGDVMVGVVTEYLPVPQRHKGNGMTIRSPSFPLPKEVKTLDQAKQYVADQFKVKPEDVSSLGESYFCHIGITPQRIFPFAVASTGKNVQTPSGGSTQYSPLAYMRYIGSMFPMVDDWNYDVEFMSNIKKAYKRFGGGNDFNLDLEKGQEMNAQDTTPRIMKTENIQGLNRGAPSASPPSTVASSASAAPPASAVAEKTAPPTRRENLPRATDEKKRLDIK